MARFLTWSIIREFASAVVGAEGAADETINLISVKNADDLFRYDCINAQRTL